MTDDRSQGRDEPVPRLPRSRGIRLNGPALFRIAMFLAMLIGILALRRSCADGVAGFMGEFESHDAGPAVKDKASPAPGATDDPQYIRLTGDMSEDEIRQKLEQAGAGADAGAAQP